MPNERILVICASVALLSACAETEFAVHTAKKLITSPQQNLKGHYKIGKPYRIKGTWYYPAVNYSYTEKGIASWYGPQFHKRKTANGEIFDMNLVSAAHRTLPLPSVVRVTNLVNGRSLKIRINDRGPFAKNRIIDLSRRAAQLLDFERQGTAPVRVDIIAQESRNLANLSNGKVKNMPFVPPVKIKIASLPGSNERLLMKPATKRSSSFFKKTLKRSKPKNIIRINPIKSSQIYVQAGSFVYRDLAVKMQKLLDPLGPNRVVPAVIGKRRYFRVQVGPVFSVTKGDKLLDLVIASGYPNARIIVD